MSDAPDKTDYRSTVFLPKTDFPMKAGLPQKEPGILARWESEGLYGQIRAARAGRDKFILHDGPPYANGDIHIGHALNHVLKDMVVRTQTLLGKDSPYVPGWDCHGLPIEWKVEEQYRKQKRNKDEVPVKEFRAECRAYAQQWVDRQREQLKRLGIGGRWDKPYLTMNFEAEATIVAELMKFAEGRQLYRGAKPVMWSPVEKTALAEAEIEYEDIVSTQIDVAFEITDSPIEELKGAHAVVWTTTPWTIPVNQAIAYGPEVDYRVVEIILRPVGQTDALSDEWLEKLRDRIPPVHQRRFLISENLLEKFRHRLGKSLTRKAVFGGEEQTGHVATMDFKTIWRGKGSDLAGTVARHPIANSLRHSRESGNPDSSSALGPRFRGDDELGFYDRPRPFLPGEFVTTDQGTGLVHMAPDHGEDDFELCKAHGIGPVFAVEGDGKYRADWPWPGGQGSVINPKFNAPDGPICSDLREAGALLAASADFQHSYPHSWRSKAKVIYRCTPQWFVAMDKPLSHLSPETRAEQRWDNEGGATTSPLPLEGGDQGVGASLGQARSGVEPDRASPTPSPSLEREGSPTLRQAAMQAIADTRWVPGKGENRIRSMVEGRPDWVLSRQRAWGVPIALFVNRKTGEPLVDPHVNARIVEAIRAEGVDAWEESRAQEFLGNDHDAADYEMVGDILDVWFDSGCTHVFTLESGTWPELLRDDADPRPADLYLEGSDQHRGWFQSSLLQSCGTRGHAPYKAVLTHGFTMDSKGMKMSKSLGNTVDPLKVMETYGADIIRLWALSVDYTEDHRIGDEILKGVADQYRKLRNTFRYLLGALDGFGEDERIAVEEMPELERYMLSLLARLDERLRRAAHDFDFNDYVRALTDFCNEDLSAFFFDIRKDSLYCDAPADPKRRAYRTVLDILFHALVRYAAPVLVFTSEEVWGTRYPDEGSVHLLEWPELPRRPSEGWGPGQDMDPSLRWDDEKWSGLRSLRQQVTEAIEPLRRDKIVGSSLEAEVTVPSDADPAMLSELFISSTVHRGEALAVAKTTNHKCGRCWRHLPEVAADGALCNRCDSVVNG